MKKSTRKHISHIIANMLSGIQVLLVIAMIGIYFTIPMIGVPTAKFAVIIIVIIETCQWTVATMYQHKSIQNKVIKKVCKNPILQLMFYAGVAGNILVPVIAGLVGPFFHINFSVTLIAYCGMFITAILFGSIQSNMIRAEQRKKKEQLEELTYWFH